MEFLDDVINVLRTLSLDTYTRKKRFETQPTVTAELTNRAKMKAARLVLAWYARPPMTARTKYIVTVSPKSHIDGIENSQKRETPGDSIDDDFLSFRGKLVDDGTQEEDMDQ